MICEYCKGTATHQFKNGIYCCNTNLAKCPEIGNRRKAGFVKKYGVENISQLQAIKKKKNDTFHKNYAEGSPSRDELINTKQETWKKKNINQVNTKRKDTCLERYGVGNPLKVSSIADSVSKKNKDNAPSRISKGRKTIKEKYGVDYISQIPEIHEKQQRYNWKNYTLPSGKVVRLQGYEDKALDVLLAKFSEDELILDRKCLPEIWYSYNGKIRRYYTDVYIPKENLIIEVKSKWTFSVKQEQHLAKRQACVDNNFKFEFWIFDDNTADFIKIQ